MRPDPQTEGLFHRFNLVIMRSAILAMLAFLFPVTGAPFTFDSLLARGDSSLSIIWTPDSANTRSSWYARCCPSSPDFSRCDFLPGVTYRGEAYSYGGEDPFAVFRARLVRGDLAGSHACHYNNCGDPSDSVTGIDCSGFVCYLWNAPRVNTTRLASSAAYVTVPKTELQPGDALVKAGSHALIVIECDEYPVVLIWESYGWPVNGCRERSINLSESYWNAYIGVRNPRLAAVSSAKPLPLIRTRLLTEKTAPAIFSIRGRRIAVSPKALPPAAYVRASWTASGGMRLARIFPESLGKSHLKAWREK